MKYRWTGICLKGSEEQKKGKETTEEVKEKLLESVQAVLVTLKSVNATNILCPVML
jgi:hypothetical protein